MFDFSFHSTSKTVNEFALTVQYSAGHGEHTNLGIDSREKRQPFSCLLFLAADVHTTHKINVPILKQRPLS